jgi:hypothetical protein
MNHVGSHSGIYNIGLYGACDGNQIDIAKFLLTHISGSIQEYFMYACEYCSLDIVKFLLGISNSHIRSGFLCACEAGRLDVIEYLLSFKSPYSCYNLKDDDKLCGISASRGLTNVVKFLYKNLTTVYQDDLETLLYYSYEIGNVELFEYFIKKSLINYKKVFCYICYSSKQDIEMTKMIMNHIVEFDDDDFKTAYTQGCFEILKLLLERKSWSHINLPLRNIGERFLTFDQMLYLGHHNMNIDFLMITYYKYEYNDHIKKHVNILESTLPKELVKIIRNYFGRTISYGPWVWS